MRFTRFIFPSALLAALLAGCATEQIATPPRTNDPVEAGKFSIEHAAAKDKVLWQYRTALEALRAGRHDEAKAILDDALLTVGGMTGKDKNARKARGYFHAESRKTFIGEPYERVMAFYYRGILYWMDGQPDNARACFRNAQLIDSDTEDKQYAADYVLLDYLDGFTSAKLAGDGTDAYQRALKEAHLGNPPPYDTKANVCFFIECGRGPEKFATGEYEEELRFRTQDSRVRNAIIKIDGQQITAGPYDDLNFQATTRGGRVMDHILANKAVFKSATDVAGDVGIIGGAIAATHHDRTTQEVGLGILAAGLVTKIVSAATTPAADIRSWDNLPQLLSFTATKLSPGAHTATVQFTDAAGNAVAGLTKTITFTVSPDKDKIIFVSDRSISP